jgi:multidrug efflux pump subunit AcrA (membrane-fusion protein)
MVCDVILNSTTEKQMVLVPYNAITKDSEGNSIVFVVNDDRKSVRKQTVKIGNYQTKGLEILSGLTANQTVVVEGKEKLTDNSQIIL